MARIAAELDQAGEFERRAPITSGKLPLTAVARRRVDAADLTFDAAAC